MTDSAPTGITITRVFDAPRELVWKEWTEPGRFADWFGGSESEVPLSTVSMDVRPGGSWRLTMLAGPERREIHERAVQGMVVVLRPDRRAPGRRLTPHCRVRRTVATCEHRGVYVSLTRFNTSDQPIENATIVAEEMLSWLRDIDGFEGMLVFSREGTTIGLTFWHSAEVAQRHRVPRMQFLGRVTSVASLQIEEAVDFELTFAHLGPRLTDLAG
jgi:uncharacterized protein YndB with AHSA1/START domain